MSKLDSTRTRASSTGPEEPQTQCFLNRIIRKINFWGTYPRSRCQLGCHREYRHRQLKFPQILISKPRMRSTKLVLPEPLPPIIPINSPFLMRKENSQNQLAAVLVPKLSSRTSITSLNFNKPVFWGCDSSDQPISLCAIFQLQLLKNRGSDGVQNSIS